jgi:hypothetical protein
VNDDRRSTTVDALIVLIAALAALIWLDAANIPFGNGSRDHLAD